MLYFIFLTFCTVHSFVHNNKLIKPKLYATQNILPSIEVKNFFGQSWKSMDTQIYLIIQMKND